MKQIGKRYPEIQKNLSKLPKFLVLNLGEIRIAVLHGDAYSLSGWSFSVEALEPLDYNLREKLKVPTTMVTSKKQIIELFEEMEVNAIACTHTCLPFAQDFIIENKKYLIINNGSAGMPNFKNTNYGLMTRASLHPYPQATLYGCRIGQVYFDAIPILYDSEKFKKSFLANWAPDSPAYISYFNRISKGPDFDLTQAVRGHLSIID